jgi:hypothetical protein
MLSRKHQKYLQNVLIGGAAALYFGSKLVPGADQPGPVSTAAAAIVTGAPMRTASAGGASGLSLEASTALAAFSGEVRRLSSPVALEDAFRGYFAYKAEHPEQVKKPYLYFVDYGLPSTTARGYVFDMDALRIVDGPFTVAHGRGSSTSQYGVPTRFSNVSGSAATSLGLYVAEGTYAFHGKSGGHPYTSVGMELMGVSEGFNDNALARRVVAHGAPYVTPTKAGRSEGCPAMEQARARQLLPMLANGGMVFLFAPNADWLAGDPWIAAADSAADV